MQSDKHEFCMENKKRENREYKKTNKLTLNGAISPSIYAMTRALNASDSHTIDVYQTLLCSIITMEMDKQRTNYTQLFSSSSFFSLSIFWYGLKALHCNLHLLCLHLHYGMCNSKCIFVKHYQFGNKPTKNQFLFILKLTFISHSHRTVYFV